VTSKFENYAGLTVSEVTSNEKAPKFLRFTLFPAYIFSLIYSAVALKII